MNDQTELFVTEEKPASPASFALGGGYRAVTHARSTDPTTSTRAAESIVYRVGSHKARLLAEYVRVAPAGLTDDEAGDLAGLPNGAWKRCSDLRADGVIVPIGEKQGTHGTPVRICAVKETV